MRIRCLLLSLLALGLPLLTGCATIRSDVRTADQGKATTATIHAVCTALDMFRLDVGRLPVPRGRAEGPRGESGGRAVARSLHQRRESCAGGVENSTQIHTTG